MPKNKPPSIHLKVFIQGVEYLLGTLSFNPAKKECSYHLHHPHDAPALHFNCDTGKDTARFDHITWHRNVAQIKREDDVAIERIELSQGPLFCNPPVTTPIYVESLYFQDTPLHCVTKASWNFSAYPFLTDSGISRVPAKP